jgi:predicted enzyme related to lactoylglutathione lyase
MIRGLHGLFYSSQPEATRAFLRDKLRLPYSDVGGGWLIFDLPEADVGVHPVESGGLPAGTHDVSFYCDDIRGTVADLRARGVQFKGEIADQGYGWVTYFTLPGGVEVQLYEPKYVKRPTAKTGKTKPSAPRAKRKLPTTSARPVKKRGKSARNQRRVR